MDDVTTIEQLKKKITAFREARDWRKYNDPKSLAEALSIEAGELLEVFLWKNSTQIEELLHTDSRYREALSDEIADVFLYVLQIATDTEIDISRAVEKKMEKNARKYPVDAWRGKATNKYSR